MLATTFEKQLETWLEQPSLVVGATIIGKTFLRNS
jgi:hypothetical protein